MATYVKALVNVRFGGKSFSPGEIFEYTEPEHLASDIASGIVMEVEADGVEPAIRVAVAKPEPAEQTTPADETTPAPDGQTPAEYDPAKTGGDDPQNGESDPKKDEPKKDDPAKSGGEPKKS